VGLVKVLIAYPLKEKHLAHLRPFSDRIELEHTTDSEKIRHGLAWAEVLVCLPQVVAIPWGPMPKLKWVHVLSAGVDEVLPYLPKEVTITATHGIQAEAVADHAFALLLALSRGIARFRDHKKALWDRTVPVDELFGKTMVIIGLGEVGRAVARRAKGFGLRVVGASRAGTPVPGVEQVLSVDRLPEVLPQAQVLLLCAPLTEKTRGLIGAGELALLPQGALLINVARGGVVDEEALIHALQVGHLAGAGLDVFSCEPLPPDSPLWHMDQVIVTPHVAGLSPHYTERAIKKFAENLDRYLRGEPLLGTVDPKAGY
jgi:phosphoglycerate dehydrogenase-like enzyme